MAEELAGIDDIESGVVEGQSGKDVSFEEGDAARAGNGEVSAFREVARGDQDGGRDVDTGRAAKGAVGGEGDCDGARAATDVEKLRGGCQMREEEGGVGGGGAKEMGRDCGFGVTLGVAGCGCRWS